MKIITNFDFFEEVVNAQEKFGPLKIVRNRKRRWAKLEIPLYLIIDFLINDPRIVFFVLSSQLAVLISGDLLAYRITKSDIYAKRAISNLKQLAADFKDLNIDTDYDLILDSELYDKKYKIKFNEKKLPYITENKYILVPTYNFNSDVKETSILQEHVVGSKTYVLSIGSPKKEFKRVYSHA